MSKLIIEGGNRLYGSINICGAKNAILPLLAATLLTNSRSVIHNCPNIADVNISQKILEHLGCKVARQNKTISVDSSYANCYEVPEILMREMRSSIVFLGAIAARFGKAVMSSPGGCELGPRPIDIHLSALRKMGMKITEKNGLLICDSNNLKGADIILTLPSVGATENIMLAAVLAKGKTVIVNAAKEPEIVDLGNFLNQCGANIVGHGTSTVIINGVDKLEGISYSTMADRIVCETYMCAVAACGGNVFLKNAVKDHTTAVISRLEDAGCEFEYYNDGIKIGCNTRPKSIGRVDTTYYPGFPTDAGTPLLSVMAVSSGMSMLVENIFENRFRCVDELKRMGADITVSGKVAIVNGVNKLHGSSVCATDLRAGAALVIAGLAAEGTTYVGGLQYIDRGYESIENDLVSVGANIKRID